MPKNTTKKTYVEVSEESKVQMIEVVDRELFIFGKQISRHPKFPWLFSITDVYKACERPIKHQATKYGKDPEKVFKSKRPGVWTQRNTGDEKLNVIAKNLRARIRNHGVGCGFGNHKKITAAANAAAVNTALSKISNRDLCIRILMGGATKGENLVVQGTYVCQDLLLSYAGFLNEKFHAKMLDSFISVLNGYTQEVTKEVNTNEQKAKGTHEREENIVLNNRLGEICGRHGIQTRVVQGEINRAVFTMPKKEYMKKNNIVEPLNDNIPIEVLIQKNMAAGITTGELFLAPIGSVDTKKAKRIAYDSGVTAKYFWNNRHRIAQEAKAEDAED